MPSKKVTDKSAAARRLRAAAKALLPRVSTEIEGALSPFLAGGESLPELARLARLAVRGVEQRADEVTAADQANLEAREALRVAREERDQAGAALRGRLMTVRGLWRGLSGRKDVWIVESRVIPQGPFELRPFARLVVGRLRDPKLPLPKSPIAGVTVEIDPEALAAELEPSADCLENALEDVVAKTADQHLTQEVKAKAMAAFDVDYATAARARDEHG